MARRKHLTNWHRFELASLLVVLVSLGCNTRQRQLGVGSPGLDPQTRALAYESATLPHGHVQPVAFQQIAPTQNGAESGPSDTPSNANAEGAVRNLVELQPERFAVDSLASLEALALSNNPRLLRLNQEVAAAEAKAAYADALPDPTIAANLFAHPIETAAGSQRANLTLRQMIPWLSRLDAQAQQAIFEALALQQLEQSERLRVVGDVRSQYYRIYVLQKQIETNQASREVLLPLIEVANARVSTGKAAQGDVLLGTLELSRLREKVVVLQQQLASATAELNRLLGRNVDHPVQPLAELQVALPDWNHAMLRQVAWEQQPEVAAAELRTQATHWGLEAARLKRRPEFSVGASWMAIDDNRPTPSLVDVGRDAWSIGAQMSLPIWQRKYDAIESEASWRHSASHASVEDVRQRYDALLRDLWERAKALAETAQLYRQTLLPQARLTLNADQQAYANGSVEFDRLVRDFRSVLMLELGLHRTQGELAATLARIKQAAGADLTGGSQAADDSDSSEDGQLSGERQP